MYGIVEFNHAINVNQINNSVDREACIDRCHQHPDDYWPMNEAKH